MNTSTKILLGLLLTVLVVPVLMAVSLKNKQKHKEFTTGTYGQFSKETIQKGQLGPYKNIQIIGPQAEALTCIIDKSEQAGYYYIQYESNDSLTVYVLNDTLFVKQIAFVDRNSTEKRTPDDIELRLHLPTIENISIDGAHVIVLDSMLSNDNIKLKLKNYGSIKSGTLNNENRTSLQSVPVQNKETVLNYQEIKIETPLVQPTSTPVSKEVKDVVIFHLM